jgi:hypothetical protein
VLTTSTPSAETDKTDEHNQEKVGILPCLFLFHMIDCQMILANRPDLQLQSISKRQMIWNSLMLQANWDCGLVLLQETVLEERNEMNKVGKKRNRKKDELRVEHQYGVSYPSPHNSTSRDKLHLEPIVSQRFLESGAGKGRKRENKQLEQPRATPASSGQKPTKKQKKKQEKSSSKSQPEIYFKPIPSTSIPSTSIPVAFLCRLPGPERRLKTTFEHFSAAAAPVVSSTRSALHSKKLSWMRRPQINFLDSIF